MKVASTQIDKKKLIECSILISLPLFIIEAINPMNLIWYGVGILITALIIPIVFFPVAKVWFLLGDILHLFSTRMILFLIYYLIVTPISLGRYVLGIDVLRIRSRSKKIKSNFRDRNHLYAPNDLLRPF